MTPPADAADERFGPWNPGIGSQVPGQLRHLATIVRPENVYTSLEKAEELRDLTGLPVSELVAFRPQRLTLHELLIRVTADVSVPDGSKIEDLGINFREITGVILARYVEPQMSALATSFEQTRRRLTALIEAELAALPCTPPAASNSAVRSTGSWLLGRIARRREAISGPRIAAWDLRLITDRGRIGGPAVHAARRQQLGGEIDGIVAARAYRTTSRGCIGPKDRGLGPAADN